jgi:hypothetical protein
MGGKYKSLSAGASFSMNKFIINVCSEPELFLISDICSKSLWGCDQLPNRNVVQKYIRWMCGHSFLNVDLSKKIYLHWLEGCMVNGKEDDVCQFYVCYEVESSHIQPQN